jgi:prepilin signal peptidase PulO-like enzyme (type II secretory pathway)
MILFSIVIVLTFIDIDFQILPNKLLIISTIPILIYILLNNLDQIVYHFAGAIVLLLAFLLIGYIGKLVYKVDSMGMGDVKYAAIIGLLLGLKLGILAFILSFFSAAVMVVVLTIFKKVDRKQRLAFGPFLSLGLFTAFFWGQNIINWYLGFYN